MALKQVEGAKELSFYRKYMAQRTILQLSMENLALQIMSFLVADNENACEDLIIGLPVLQHLKIESLTLLDSLRDLMDGTDCKKVGNQTTSSHGSVGRLMVASLQQIKGNS